MSSYISDQRTNTPASLCHILLLPTDTEQLPSPLFLQLVCFCCQKSEYSHQAIPPRTKHRMDTNQTHCLLQGVAAANPAILVSQPFIWKKSLYCPGMSLNQQGAFSRATKEKVDGHSLLAGRYQVPELHGSFPVSSCSSGCPFSHTNPQPQRSQTRDCWVFSVHTAQNCPISS